MSDIVITAASVIAGEGVEIESGTLGATFAAGKVAYRDPTTKKYGLADSNGATATKVARGLALSGGADGQPGFILKKGPITLGAVLTPGDPYYLSDTPGGICPKADVGSGENVVLIGLAISASVLMVDIQNSGVTL